MRPGFETAVDPLQQRYRELIAQQRQIVTDLRELRRQMRVGTCEVCGKEFVRARVTKKHCSQTCTVQAYGTRIKATGLDIDLLRETLPILREAHFVSGRTCDVIARVLAVGNQAQIADEVGLSRQRIEQMMVAASRQARLVKTILMAASTQTSVPPVTEGYADDHGV